MTFEEQADAWIQANPNRARALAAHAEKLKRQGAL